jgi:hypothetical protein
MTQNNIKAIITAIGFVASTTLIQCGHAQKKVQTKATDALVLLENGGTRIGVLSQIGGTVVFFQKGNSQNLLEADSALWNEPENQKPIPNAFSQWKAYKGHTVWLGPQSEWWTHQTLNLVRRDEKAAWPPDPYLIFGDYKIEHQTKNELVLSSPKSPVSGIRLIKSISIDTTGKVTVKATAVNVKDEAISWDVWHNTRVNGFAHCYVPVQQGLPNRVKSNFNEMSDSIAYSFVNGFFTYLPSMPRNGKHEGSTKAFLFPEHPYMAAFDKGFVFLIRFHDYPIGQLHPKQALVETYNCVSVDGKSTVLEMEHHGPYQTLKPGESISVTETWEAIPYNGANTTEAQTEFLKQKIK